MSHFDNSAARPAPVLALPLSSIIQRTVPAPDSGPLLRFPELYIVAPLDGVAAVYSLAAVPSETFGAWLAQLVADENAVQVAIRLAQQFVAGRQTVAIWGIQEKWQALNELAEAKPKIEMHRYLFDSPAAARASINTQKVEAVRNARG